MKEPCCAICKVGSINCAGNGWYLFKTSPTCCWITWTASSTTAALKYRSEWWKPSTATSRPFFEEVAATRISDICCSKLSAWQSPRLNSSFFRKRLKCGPLRILVQSRFFWPWKPRLVCDDKPRLNSECKQHDLVFAVFMNRVSEDSIRFKLKGR